MFSPTKIKWTIDAEKSEIIFKEKCLVLAGCKDIKQNIYKENSLENIHCYQFFDKITSYEKTQEFNNGGENILYVKAKEYLKKINYNLVVFEEKNSLQFWKRNTFSGLLILNDYSLNILITLYKNGHDFNNNGAASATYFVKGELDKNQIDLDSEELEENEMMILNSVLLFEGEIKLVQDEGAI
ncbi:MAG: hypothetical protein ABI359_15110 [Ginsengibacter sp.]